MQRIDTHQHLLYPNRFSYGWAKDFEALQGAFTLEDYWKAAEGSEINGTLFMEVDVDAPQSADEAAFFCQLAESPENHLLGVIAAARPENDDFEAQLERIEHAKLKGIRRVLHTQPDDLLEAPQLVKSLRLLGDRELSFDFCVLPSQHEAALKVMKACPNTRFILDHLGNPTLDEESFGSWKASIAAIAELPNVACKVSGIIAGAGDDRRSASGLKPWIETAIETFGWDRVIFGGDWPVCNLSASLGEWVSILDEVLANESSDRINKLYSANASAFYNL